MKSRLLVVDDEESIREFLEIMLKKEGYEVTTAEDGLRAKELLQKKSFDMVISDLQMPNMTGIDLLKYVKESYPDVVFMLITGAIQWIASDGDKGTLETSRTKIVHAIIGLIILFSVFAIIKLIQGLFGISILTLDISSLNL